MHIHLANPVRNHIFLVLHCRFRACGEGKATQAFLRCWKYIRDDLQSVFQNIKSPRYSVLITAEKPVGDLSSPNETKYIISWTRIPWWSWRTGQMHRWWCCIRESAGRWISLSNVPDSGPDAGLYRCVVTAWSPVRQPVARSSNQSLQSYWDRLPNLRWAGKLGKS